jgi:hypothetical protein
MEIDGLLGAPTEELTRVANNPIEVLTPMGVGVVAGMLLPLHALRRPRPRGSTGGQDRGQREGAVSPPPRRGQGEGRWRPTRVAIRVGFKARADMIEFAEFSEVAC